MNRVEAQRACLEGKKITHNLFADNEYVYLRQTDKQLVDENETILNHLEFWQLRSGTCFVDGWSIWRQK